MKELIGESLRIFGANVMENTNGSLYVQTPPGSKAEALFGDISGNILSFTPGSSNENSIMVGFGSRLMDRLHFELGRFGSIRHGRLPAEISIDRKTIKNQYPVFSGDIAKLSVRQVWLTTVNVYFRLATIADELMEELIAIEIPYNGSPKIRTNQNACSGIEWVDRPVLTCREIEERLRQGWKLAEIIATRKAEEFRKDSIDRLYHTLSSLRRYYRQLMEEAGGSKENENAGAIENEYRQRKSEEISLAGLRLNIELIALETVAEPVKKVTFSLQKNEASREISFFVGIRGENDAHPVICEVCRKATSAFGLTSAGTIVCRDCYAVCVVCRKEIIEQGASIIKKCRACHQPLCRDHLFTCDVCKQHFCLDHIQKCSNGCHVCGNCVSTCLDCGDQVDWCRHHLFFNSKGLGACRKHAVSCIGCRENHPASQMETCCFCGQTVCSDCRVVCECCGRIFCLNHINSDGRCLSCRTKERKVK